MAILFYQLARLLQDSNGYTYVLWSSNSTAKPNRKLNMQDASLQTLFFGAYRK